MSTDPYHYLEDGTDPATVAWQREQNVAARAALDALPGRDALRDRFDRLSRVGGIGAPVVRGERKFFTMRTGVQEQSRLLLAEAGAEDRVLIDPVAIDASGLTSLDWWYPSATGRYVAYGLSKNGDEKSTLHVLDVTQATQPAEAIPNTRWTSLAWLPDDTGFYYTANDGSDFNKRLFVHSLGTPHGEDRMVLGDGFPPEDNIGCSLSADGRWLLASVTRGWDYSEIRLADRHSPEGDGRFVTIFAKAGVVAHARTSARGLVVTTTEDAPNSRVFLVDPEHHERSAWREIVAEGADALDFAVPVRSGIVLGWLHNVSYRIALLTHGGRTIEIPLGTISIGDISAEEDSDEAYVATSTFFEPTVVHRLTLASSGVETERWRRLDGPIDPAAYRSQQIWCDSKDGTKVPMFVLSRADTPLDGTAPAIVYGYGGFAIAITPDYTSSIIPWLDAGGIYSMVNLRGGSEFGEAWHRAGMREHKQNVFDDYAAAIEHLAAARLADPERIAAYGGSNGGLLVAALATQRPELVRAVICAVPVIDMLRFHLFSVGRMWIPEYGDPDAPDDAAFLRAYSPYEHVREGARYPAMLLVAAMSDSRVDPMHARKFAAKLQAAGGPDAAPILCHIESEAGHGQGKPRHKQLDDLVDRFAFAAWQLGVDLAGSAGAVAVTR